MEALVTANPTRPMICEPVELDLDGIQPLDLPGDGAPVLVKRAKAKLATGRCTEASCRAPLREAGKQQGAKFCSKQCSANFANRQKVQGRQVVNIAKRWRRMREKGDFTAMCRMLDRLIADDKAMGINTYPEPPIEAFQIRRNISIKARR